MTELSLFSGAGGGLLGTKLLGFKCVGYVEQDEYCQRVLRARIRDGFLDDAPIFADVRTFNGLPYRGRVDCLTAGFPCQPFSVAGRKQGEADERNLWPDTVRIIGEVRPPVAFLENVPGLLNSGYFGTILSDLADAGYDARWCCVSAGEVGAPHIRKRLWILATDADGVNLRQRFQRNQETSGIEALTRDDGEEQSLADAASKRKRRLSARSRDEGQGETHADGRGEDVADANGTLRTSGPGREEGQRQARRGLARCDWWKAEPAVGRVVDGLADRMVQLRALGNGQVSRVVVEAWERLTEASR